MFLIVHFRFIDKSQLRQLLTYNTACNPSLANRDHQHVVSEEEENKEGQQREEKGEEEEEEEETDNENQDDNLTLVKRTNTEATPPGLVKESNLNNLNCEEDDKLFLDTKVVEFQYVDGVDAGASCDQTRHVTPANAPGLQSESNFILQMYYSAI